MLVRSGAVDVIVVDSVAALTPRAELEGEMGDAHVGLQARLMSQALRKLTGTISKSNTLVIFINQIRMKIGVMFGNPETTTGGNALKFYASCRLDIRRVGALKDGEQVVGNRTRVKVVKNKMAPPFREVEFDILYGEGISREGDLVDLGAECGAVEKSGAWFGFEGDRIGQGRENAKQYLRDHPDVARKIEAKVLAHHGINRDGGRRGRERRGGPPRARRVAARRCTPSAHSRSRPPRSAAGRSRAVAGATSDRRTRSAKSARAGSVAPTHRGWRPRPRRRGSPSTSRGSVSYLFQNVSPYTITAKWPPRRPRPKGPSKSPRSSRSCRCATPCSFRGRSSPSTWVERSR